MCLHAALLTLLAPFMHWTLQDKINQVSVLAHKVKTKVEALDKLNEEAKKVKGQGEGTAGERTRTTITAGLKKKLKDLMGEFSDLRNTIQDEYREVVERRVYTVTGAGWGQVHGTGTACSLHAMRLQTMHGRSSCAQRPTHTSHMQANKLQCIVSACHVH
jgi:hypothetical protein